MKTYQTVLFVLTCIFLTATFIACTTPEQQSAAQDLAETITAATKDGVITQAEADSIAVKMKAYTAAPSYDWATLGATAVGTLVAGLFGIRFIPNSAIIGKQEALHLEKASGV